jgi:hypothetical protein
MLLKLEAISRHKNGGLEQGDQTSTPNALLFYCASIQK